MLIISYYYYWLVVWNIFYFSTFHTLGIITPTDFHIFQRGRSTTNQINIIVALNRKVAILIVINGINNYGINSNGIDINNYQSLLLFH